MAVVILLLFENLVIEELQAGQYKSVLPRQFFP